MRDLIDPDFRFPVQRVVAVLILIGRRDGLILVGLQADDLLFVLEVDRSITFLGIACFRAIPDRTPTKLET